VFDEVVPVGELERPERLAVMSVRRYGDGSYKYSVGAIHGGDDDRAAIYREDQLIGTDKRAAPEEFASPGTFTVRDVVAVSHSHPDPEIAGFEAGWSVDDDGVVYAVWVPALHEAWDVKASFLIPTGRRLPAPDRARLVTSVQVGMDGSFLSSTEYLVVEDVDDLL
jgi:hypothetical protein